jgi:RNA polymerase sigma-70 factor (ECF subfamily)
MTEDPIANAERDLQQVARAQRDPAASEPLYDRYLDQIYAFCYRRLGSRELAEDATSQVFVRAIAALPNFQSISFRGWLFAIARNVVADVRRERPATDIDEVLNRHERIAEDSELDHIELLDLRQLLKKLTPEQRDVIELRLSGLTAPEIGHIVGRNPGAVRALQFRAIEQLRVWLAPNEVTT